MQRPERASVPRRAAILLWLQMAGAVLGSVAVFIGLSLGVVLPAFRENLMTEKRHALRDEVAMAWHLLDKCHDRELAGELTRQEAQDESLRILRAMQFGADGKNYLWINDLDIRMIMHPYRPDLEGQDVTNYAGPDGKLLFQDFVSIARSRGAGYSEYSWQWMDDPSRDLPKLSYVRLYAPWGWVVGTGVYIDDVDREATGMMRGVVRASALAGAALLLLSLHLIAIAVGRERRRARAQQALTESERRLTNIVESLPEAVVVADAERRIVEWNRAAEQLMGASREEMIGKRVEDCGPRFYGDMQPVLLARVYGPVEDPGGRYTDVVQDADRVQAESYCPAVPGGGGWILASACPLRDQNGRVVGAVETMQNVTARRHAERERAELQEQLGRAQRMEVMGRLAGGIAHDFNNLLTPILGSAELVMLTPGITDDTRERLAHVVEAAKRAGQLTRQLLAFGKQQAFERAPLQLNQVISGFEPIIRGALREDIDLQLDLARDLGTMTGSVGQIEQVLMNLVVNAQDAMPEGGAVRIRTENRVIDGNEVGAADPLPPGEYVCLSIEDTGVGMEALTREHVFEPFFTTKPSGRGTGLGLSTVYGTVKEHGGGIWLYSEPGQGTTFRVFFPLLERAVDTAPRPTLASLAVDGTETILVAEDDDAVRDLVVRTLMPHGYTVHAASNGAEAVRLAEGEGGPIDLLLSDVIMPSMSGTELQRHLRERQPELRTLFMSGYAADYLTEQQAGDSLSGFLPKPFSSVDLLRAVRQLLDTGSSAAPSAQQVEH